MPKSWALDAASPASVGVAVCVALSLSACGGGGGGGSNVKPTPPPPVVDTSPMVVSTDLAVASGQMITRPIVLESGADLDNQGTLGSSAVDIGVEAKAPSIVTNHGGGTIRGTKTAIRLDQGGEIHNGAGSTIQATGVGGSCGAALGCAISTGLNEQLQPWEVDFKLVNEGTILGNVNMASNGFNWVRLLPGSVVQGDLDFGSNGYASVLELDGAAGTTQRYSAAVTGNALSVSSLTKSGDGTWIIDKDLTPFQVRIDGGTLQIGDGGTTGSVGTGVGFNISNGRLVFDRSDDLVISSSIIGNHHDDPSESSTLVKAGPGVLTLTNDNTLIRPDFIVIENGTLQIHNTGDLPPASGNIPLMAQVTNNASLVFNSNMIVYQNGTISGIGSVTQEGSSALVLNGPNTYSGGTTINSGALLSAQLLPGNVMVGPGGKLGGYSPFFDDSIGVTGMAGDLSNRGTTVVAGGDGKVGGNYSQSSTGTLAVSLGSKLDVTGTATLGGTLEVMGADNGYIANTHTEVLAAQGGVVGTFDRLVKDAGLVFTSTTINYDAHGAWLDTTGLAITQAAVGDGIGYTPASMSGATRVQGAFEQLNGKVGTDSLAGVSSDFLHAAGQFQRAPSIAAAQASLRSLSGQLHAASAAMTFRAIDAGNQALSARLDGIRSGSDAIGMWTRQLGGNGNMARNGFDGVGYQMNGWLVGNDYRIGRNGVAGFAFGQGTGVQQLQHGIDRDDSRRSEGMVYAGLMGDRWYAQGRVGFGNIQQLVDRQLLLGDADEGVWTRYDGRYQAAYGESGLRFGVGGLRIAPFASVEYARSDRDAFAEEGAGGFGLRSDAQALSRWEASLGLRAARHWDFGHGRTLDFGTHAQWRRTLGMGGDGMDASFVGLQQWSPLAGIGLSRYGSLFGLGLDAQLSPHAALRFSYDYERGQYDSAQGFTAGVNLAF